MDIHTIEKDNLISLDGATILVRQGWLSNYPNDISVFKCCLIAFASQTIEELF